MELPAASACLWAWNLQACKASPNLLFWGPSLKAAHRDAYLALQHELCLFNFYVIPTVLFVGTSVGGDLKYELTVQSWADMFLIWIASRDSEAEVARMTSLKLNVIINLITSKNLGMKMRCKEKWLHYDILRIRGISTNSWFLRNYFVLCTLKFQNLWIQLSL